MFLYIGYTSPFIPLPGGPGGQHPPRYPSATPALPPRHPRATPASSPRRVHSLVVRPPAGLKNPRKTRYLYYFPPPRVSQPSWKGRGWPQEAPKGPKRPQEGPKKAPRGPKKAPRGPKKAQTSPKKAPRGHKKAPQRPQEAKQGPRGFKKGPRGPTYGPLRASLGPRGALSSHSGPILGLGGQRPAGQTQNTTQGRRNARSD